jgi:hypothetical protein
VSDPPRLFSGEASEFERELLGSWNAEQPSEDARVRARAIAAPAVLVGAIATKAGAAAGGSLAPKAGALGAVALAKWLVLGALGVTAAAVSVGYLRHAGRSTPSFHPSVVEVPAPTTTSPQAIAPAPTAAAPFVTTTAAPQPRATAPGPARHGGGHATDDALGEQVTALDRARRALGDGDSAAALRQLDEYESRFARGALVEEAEVLRVEALLAANDRAAAARVGARFLAAHPSSPHADRVRALLGQPAADR